MKIKLGRGFIQDLLTDSSCVILNETALKQFDIGGDPLGKKISTFRGSKPDGTPDPTKIKSWTVIGIVEDFHFESLKQSITPLSFFLERSDGNVIFRYEAAEISHHHCLPGSVCPDFVYGRATHQGDRDS